MEGSDSDPKRITEPIPGANGAGAGLPRRWIRWGSNHRSSVDQAPSGDLDDEAAEETESERDVVHKVLRRTDKWFGYRLSEVEKRAVELAADQASKGLPRHDQDRDQFDEEKILEARAREALSGWSARVKRLMQGEIAREMESLGEALKKTQQAIIEIAAARKAIHHQHSRTIEQVALSAPLADPRPEADHAPSKAAPEWVESERLLPGYWFWPLMLLLVLADFFANVPVFVELFPTNRIIDEAFMRWEMDQLSAGLPTWFGVVHLLKRVTVYPEPSILALSVVVFFLFLGHSFGGSLRALVVLWRHRTESVSRAFASFWRQSGWPAALSLVGIGLTVFVLYEARSRVLPMAESRLVEAEALVAEVETRMSDLQEQGASLPAAIFQELASAQEERANRIYRVDYARAIGGMNLPIALLNTVLIIAAIIIGYLRERRRFEALPSTVPERAEQNRRRQEQAKLELEKMTAEMGALRAKLAESRAAAHAAIGSGSNAILRIEHLLDAPISGDWYPKAERLRAVIALFRVENARLRGHDVGDIRAFQTEYTMKLPSAGELELRVETPPAFESYRAEHQRLEERLAEIDRDDFDPELAWAPNRVAEHREEGA